MKHLVKEECLTPRTPSKLPLPLQKSLTKGLNNGSFTVIICLPKCQSGNLCERGSPLKNAVSKYIAGEGFEVIDFKMFLNKC